MLVPAARLSKVGAGETHALVQRKVHQNIGRSIRVDSADGDTEIVASSQVHHEIQVALVALGDFKSETALIDPVRKSLDPFFSLLLPEDRYDVWRVRTKLELEERLSTYGKPVTHLVLVGHSDGDVLYLAGEQSLSGEELSALLAKVADNTPKMVLSLACKTGRAEFAKPLSQGEYCIGVLAPFNDIHGAEAALLGSTYFSELLLRGSQSATARKRARQALPSPARLSWWVDGTKLPVPMR